MYKIYADTTLIYDSTLEDYEIGKGEITKEVNKAGSFVFTIYPDNPFYDRIQKLKTIITVYKGDIIVFRGRVLNDQIGFYNDKTFTCEGELAFLNDSIIRPYEFTGSPEALFRQYIEDHNAQVDEEKRFQVGEVTVVDDNDYITRANEDYESTLTNVTSRLLDLLGGYIHISRGNDGVPVINWFSDYPYESGQNIEFGENLLDYTRTNDGAPVATVIIPLGAKIQVQGSEEEPIEERLTIKDVNDGLDYILDEEAVEKYGRITSVVIWDDVTIDTNLLTKARAYLIESVNQTTTIELTALDLSLMDKSIDSFQLGDYIRIVSPPHNIDSKLLLEKQTIDLLKPDNDKITLGYSFSSFTETSLNGSKNTEAISKKVNTIESNYVPNTVVQAEVESLRSLINQTSTEISSEILAEYVLNGQLTEAISTVYTQLNDSFSFNFSELTSKVNDNDAEARREFAEIKKYIRFEDGNIVLGESGNELTLKIENDKISFFEGSSEVAYFSNQKLYITDAEILASLRIGNFSFIPRANGNLSFKKVGG